MAIKRHQLIYPNLTRKWKMTQTPPRIINVDNIRIKLTKGLLWHVNPTTSKLYRLYDQTQTLTIPTWLARHIWRSGATLFINGSLVLFFLFYNAEIKQNSVHGITGVVWGKLGHLLHETFMLKPFPQWCRHGHGCCTIDIDKDKDIDRFVFGFSIITITGVTVLLLQSHTHYNIAKRNIGQNNTFSASGKRSILIIFYYPGIFY